jgi:flagellar motility protein MotE (MotC chaperone)
MKPSDIPRIFPVLLAAAAFLLLFKIAALLFNSPQQIAAIASAEAQEQPKPVETKDKPKEAAPAKATEAANPKASPKPVAEKVVAQPIQPTEAKILQRLAERRQALDKRNKQLDLRENLIKAAEAKIDQKITELKKINAKIEKIYATQDEKKKKQLKKLVSMYANMKPKDAARIFNTLHSSVLIDVAEQMNARKMSPILAAMTSAAAERLTLALAARARGQTKQQQPGKTVLPKIIPDNPS